MGRSNTRTIHVIYDTCFLMHERAGLLLPDLLPANDISVPVEMKQHVPIEVQVEIQRYLKHPEKGPRASRARGRFATLMDHSLVEESIIEDGRKLKAAGPANLRLGVDSETDAGLVALAAKLNCHATNWTIIATADGGPLVTFKRVRSSFKAPQQVFFTNPGQERATLSSCVGALRDQLKALDEEMRKQSERASARHEWKMENQKRDRLAKFVGGPIAGMVYKKRPKP